MKITFFLSLRLRRFFAFILCSLLIFGGSSSHATSLNPLRHPLLSGAAVVATGVYMKSAMHQARDLSFDLDKVGPFFARHPDRWDPVAQYVLHSIHDPQTREGYDRYYRLAQVMGLNVPPYEPPLLNTKPEGYLESHETSHAIETYPQDQESSPSIIYTPQGEPFNPYLEYPGEPITTWEDYILIKADSKILADNMKAAGMGTKPKGYAAHHIIPANDDRFSVCQDLRDLLAANGIDINDASNGVYLPHSKEAQNNAKEAPHPYIHTEDYYQSLFNQLRNLETKPRMQQELHKIKTQLLHNNYPY